MVGVVGLGTSATAAATASRGADTGQDGRIAFVRANQLYSMNRFGGDVRQLTRSGRNYRPAWSPDGRRISFIHEAGGRKDVWVMAAGGARPRAVTSSGDVTSAGASWSADGRVLAYATSQLMTIRSTAPYGAPRAVNGYATGGYCGGEDDGTRSPVYVDRFVAWSPDGTRIAVLDHSDCYFDDRIDHVFVASGEQRQFAASGADCCGYYDWTDLFWGPGNQFGYSQRDLGPYGEDTAAPSRIVYPGFASLDGDTGGAPSPSGAFLALTNASSGTATIIRARADGSGRRALATGYQPDWQVRPR